jgi:lytic murein transglycosylase
MAAIDRETGADRGTEARIHRRHRLATRLAGAGLTLLLVAGCSSTGTASPPAVVAPAAPVRTEPVADARTQSFPEWLAGLRAEAQRQGIATATLDRAFAQVHLLDRVLELDSTQPEFARPVWSYLDSAVSDQRIHEGYQRLAANAALLARVSAQFGVPGEILVAFWGIESDFGRECGNFSVIDALTTLAYRSHRPALFREELLAALRILDNGDISLEQMRGSWAGAMGQTQFVPTIFLKHAVDYDHDGRRDIWNSLPDIFASTAHFVAGIGWRTGESWGQEVRLPPDFPWDQAELTITKPVTEWTRLGVRPMSGPALSDDGPASILAPAGHTGPAFLVRENFRVIMRYNPSISYALAVALLADRMTGAKPIVAPWPRQEAALSRSERIELQQRLAALGLNPGATDSLIGPTTRTAVRSFQKTIGEVPDGFVTRHLLETLRLHSPSPA